MDAMSFYLANGYQNAVLVSETTREKRIKQAVEMLKNVEIPTVEPDAN
jgi:hypothetical protein